MVPILFFNAIILQIIMIIFRKIIKQESEDAAATKIQVLSIYLVQIKKPSIATQCQSVGLSVCFIVP